MDSMLQGLGKWQCYELVEIPNTSNEYLVSNWREPHVYKFQR